ncbi:MAG: glycosyltransferase family 4 protein [Verrucomicrobiae bacterium]|nr:glycosyltransferase family 4 protein [Verrucomicrobiae bacterium]
MSRFRVYQHLPMLKEEGVEGVVSPAVPSADYGPDGGRKSLGVVLKNGFKTFTRRVRNLHELRDYDYVFVQKTVLPAPFFNMEWRFSRQVKVIFDLDEPIFLKRPDSSLLGGLWPQERRLLAICRSAHRVVVENSFLAKFVSRAGVDPAVIPSAIDIKAYEIAGDAKKSPRKIPAVGWIGSQRQQAELRLATPSLIDLHSRTPFVVRLIGATLGAIPARFPIECKPWDLRTEAADLASLDIGLAPREDTEWNQCCSGLRILQYWAAGVPVVASPVGVYSEMVRDGENGFLAGNRDEWTEKLCLLIKNQELRRKFASEGRRTLQKSYSLPVVSPQLARVFSD